MPSEEPIESNLRNVNVNATFSRWNLIIAGASSALTVSTSLFNISSAVKFYDPVQRAERSRSVDVGLTITEFVMLFVRVREYDRHC